MSAVTFDTPKWVDALEKVQIPREQARAIMDGVRASHDGADVATKGDVRELEHRMDTRFAQTDAKIDLVRLSRRWKARALIANRPVLLLRRYGILTARMVQRICSRKKTWKSPWPGQAPCA